MPYFPPEKMPVSTEAASPLAPPVQEAGDARCRRIRVKNRRKLYLDRHPAYFSASALELADPLLYDRCIRRFQSAAEREAEGRRKGYSGVLEADLMRAEAKVAALADAPDPDDAVDAAPASREEGEERWRQEMTARFLRGHDADFDYATVDDSEEWDDRGLEEREAQERWLDGEEAAWVVDGKVVPEGEGRTVDIKGETGIQDF
ncbi:MAG: hypothetical protein M1832_005718 [Thelocarpon impressellum]|nr:MAG: hypothetical protein M1832_005718 [Thelocarpon impressellum]